ncbi:hypothetical protein NM688_g3251 [Phlebia brevispora]|uniref:Uncharacterized protein n=1 Tax=Phlebia brevispora TaxID=194682 RepID=A0ACC1T6E2_9APHY|nr:hypothetical protein NM688_g3251 [Phlebia brevispora]
MSSRLNLSSLAVKGVYKGGEGDATESHTAMPGRHPSGNLSNCIATSRRSAFASESGIRRLRILREKVTVASDRNYRGNCKSAGYFGGAPGSCEAIRGDPAVCVRLCYARGGACADGLEPELLKPELPLSERGLKGGVYADSTGSLNLSGLSSGAQSVYQALETSARQSTVPTLPRAAYIVMDCGGQPSGLLQYVRTHTLPPEHAAAISALAINAEGTLLGSCDMDGVICIWYLPSGAILQRMRTWSSVLLCMKWLPWSDTELVCGTEDGTLLTIELKQRKGRFDVRGVKAHEKAVESIALRAPTANLAPNPRDPSQLPHLLATSGRNTIRTWSWQDKVGWKKRSIIESDRVTTGIGKQPVVVSGMRWMEAVDSLLVSFMHHGIICWSWDPEAVSYVAAWSIHMEFCGPCLPHRDNTRLIVYNMVTGFHVYQIPSGLHEYTLEPSEATGIWLPVEFAHGKSLIVGGSDTGKVRIWDTSKLDHLQTLRHDGSLVQAIATHYQESSDTSMIVTGTSIQDSKNIIQIWETRGTGGVSSIVGSDG